MSAQHAPGPWRRMGHRHIADAAGNVICEVWSGPSGIEQADANETLIAAATELFAELQNIANAKRFDRHRFDCDTAFADWAQSRCRAAIAKVTGAAQ